ncbi:MAG: hypothetical protein ACJ74Z_16150 [Bryobacteraceae bacterium]
MQEKTSQKDTDTSAFPDWEFKFDGTFVEKQMPELRQDGDWEQTLYREGWTNEIALGSETQVVEARILRKARTLEFLIDLWDCDQALGLIYCANLPTLLEFFRKYESFLSLGRRQEFNEAISNVNRYLFDERDGLDVVRQIAAKNRAQESRARQARKAQSAQKTSS